MLSDKEIRKPLLKFLYSNKKNIKIIEELDVHGAIVDIATINKNYFCGYEIKSDRDTLQRLSTQMQIYNYVFDKITIVICPSKLFDVTNVIPNFWGIIIANLENYNINLVQIRTPELNTNINIQWLSKKLWKSDIVRILKKKNLYKGQSWHCRDGLLRILMDNSSLDELKSYIREVLINRFYDNEYPRKINVVDI